MPIELAYGFVGLQHLFSERVSTVGVERVFTAVQESAAEWSRQVTELMSSMVQPTTMAQWQYELAGTKKFQPLDEYGVPRPANVTGSYKVALPIQSAGDAWGGSRIATAMMTVEEVNRQTVESQKADAAWIMNHILAALFHGSTWTYSDLVGGAGSKGLGDIIIQPLANGDTVTYNKVGGTSATADHYTAQASAIGDANNPFKDFRKTLHNYPANSGTEIVSYVPTNLVDDVEALADFKEVEDPDVRAGANRDELIADIATGFGDELIGKVNKCWVVEWKRLPDSYILNHARGSQPVVGMREYASTELQGLQSKMHMNKNGSVEYHILRDAGFGVLNRLGALVHRVGSGSYAPPAEYTTMPIG